MSAQLTHEPSTPTRHRKQLHPNSLAGWELRIGDHRMFYDIDLDESLVAIIAVGVKRHDKLLIAGEEIEL